MNSLFSWGSPLTLQLLPPTHLQQTPTSPSAKKHQQSMELMAETLSYYINYQTHFISPDSIDSYLSRIINQLEPYHLDVYKHWGSLLVKQTLKGAWRMYSKGVCQRETLVSPGFRVHVNVIGRIIFIWWPAFQSTTQYQVLRAISPWWIGQKQ